MIEYLDRDIPLKHGLDDETWVSLPTADKFSLLAPSDRKAILEQARDCTKDFSYAARNYFWIVNQKKQDQLMSLWQGQHLILQKWYDLKEKYPKKAQKIIIVKARRLGCSYLIEAMLAWRSMFFPNTRGLVVSVDEDSGADLFSIMAHIYTKLPWWLKPMLAAYKYREGIFFDNPDEQMRAYRPGLNSKVEVQFASQVSGVGQGRAIDALHASEVSDWPEGKAEDILEADLTPALDENNEVFGFLESTGRGAGTYFHRLWKTCERRMERAEWYPVFLPWFFETKRVLAPPGGWHIQKPEAKMRDRVAKEWAQCTNCKEYRRLLIHGELTIGTPCPECEQGTFQAVSLQDEQLFWKQDKREQAEEKGKPALRKHLQEFACVIGETRISADCGIVRIGESPGITSVETGAVQRWYNHGMRETLCVKTTLGREVICTLEHRFYDPAMGEHFASDLTVGQPLALSPPRFSATLYTATWQHSPTCKSSVVIDEDWGRLLGYFMGDGSWRGRGVQVACDGKDQDTVADVAALMARIIGSASRKTQRGGATLVDSSNVLWFDLLLPIGAIGHWHNSDWGYKRTVCVPECIWRSPKEVVRQFLSALFECDAHAYKDSARTAFFTMHEQFARDVQLLLLGFGINSQIKTALRKRANGKQYPGRFIYLHPAASNRFHQEIGFISERKRTTACVRPYSSKRPEIYRNEMVDAVASVEPAGLREVYDLTVAPSHRYGANGLLTHNTTPEESFQLQGNTFFDDNCLEWVNHCIRDPIKAGKIYRGSSIDKEYRPPEIHGASGRDGHCYVKSCRDDHRHDDVLFQVWEEPIPGRRYSVGVDPSDGLGEDYGVIWVNKLGERGGYDEQVAMFRDNNTSPKELAYFANVIGRWYNDALMSVEYNLSQACGNDLVDYWQYPNIFQWSARDAVQNRPLRWHWYTRVNTKPLLNDTAKHWLQGAVWCVRAKEFAHEMTVYTKDKAGSVIVRAIRGENDDVLMAGMIALYCPHERDSDESGRIPVMARVEEEKPARYKMTCTKCHFTWGAQNPELEYRCPQEACGSIRLKAESLENAQTAAYDHSQIQHLLAGRSATRPRDPTADSL